MKQNIIRKFPHLTNSTNDEVLLGISGNTDLSPALCLCSRMKSILKGGDPFKDRCLILSYPARTSATWKLDPLPLSSMTPTCPSTCSIPSTLCAAFWIISDDLIFTSSFSQVSSAVNPIHQVLHFDYFIFQFENFHLVPFRIFHFASDGLQFAAKFFTLALNLFGHSNQSSLTFWVW